MRLSEFWRAMADEFGLEYGRALSRDLVLARLGNRTAEQCVAAGVSVREVWVALCQEMDVPQERWYGVGQVRNG